MLARNNEKMRGCLRVDVSKHDAAIVLVYKFTGYFTGDDLTKQATDLGHIERSDFSEKLCRLG
jgi:hypothetical protein